MSKDGVKIFENSQWIVWDWGVEEIVEHSGSGYWMEKGNLKAEPQMYFEHVMVKSWVDPDLWLEAMEKAFEAWGVRDIHVDAMRKSVPLHKERKELSKETSRRIGDGGAGLFEYEDMSNKILEEMPEKFPIHTQLNSLKGGNE